MVAYYCATRTVVADYRGNVSCQCRGFSLLHREYRGFRLSRKRAVHVLYRDRRRYRLLRTRAVQMT